jgi:hypothetical protein
MIILSQAQFFSKRLRKLIKRGFQLTLLGSLIIYSCSLIQLVQYRFFVLSPPTTLSLQAITLAGTGIDAVFHSVNRVRRALEVESLPATSKLRVIELYAKESAFDEMASDPPKSAKRKYYPARLRYPDGELRSISFRFRGRSFWHFHREKPSIRLKLPEGEIWHLQRAINLINPEDRAMMSNPLGEELARALGVLAPKTELVRVMLNGKMLGVYHQTTHEDVFMLRQNRRVDGSFFAGDHLSRKWRASHFKSSNDTHMLSFDPMAKLIEALYSPLSLESLDALWRVLSLRQFAAWQAAMNLAGGVHTDFVHNNLFFYDTALQKLEPVVSDINGHGLQTGPKEGERLNIFRGAHANIPLNERMHPLLDRALRDPRFLHFRNRFLHSAIESFGSAAFQLSKVNLMYESISSDVRADAQKGAIDLAFIGWYRFPYGNRQFDQSVERLRQWILKRETYLKKHLYNTTVAAYVLPVESDKFSVEIAVSGNSGALFDPQKFTKALEFELPDGSRRAGGILSKPVLLLPGLRAHLDTPHPSLKLNREPEHLLSFAPQYYRLHTTGLTLEELQALLQSGFRSALSQKPLGVEISTLSSPRSFTPYNEEVIHAWEVFPPGAPVILLGPGRVVLKSNLHIPAGETLTVKAGTSLVLAEGVTVSVQGKTRFLGEPQNPIEVIVSDKAQVILRSAPFEDQSRLSHVKFQAEGKGGVEADEGEPLVTAIRMEQLEFENVSFQMNGSARIGYRQIYGSSTGSGLLFDGCSSVCLKSEYGELLLQKLSFSNAGRSLLLSGTLATFEKVAFDAVRETALDLRRDARVSVAKSRSIQVNNLIHMQDSAYLVLDDVEVDMCQVGVSIGEGEAGYVKLPRLDLVGEQKWECAEDGWHQQGLDLHQFNGAVDDYRPTIEKPETAQ